MASDNLQPVAAPQPQQQAAPPAASVAPGPVFGGGVGFGGPPDTGAGVTPGTGGIGSMLGNAAGWLVNAPGSGGVLAPKAASPTDLAAAPAPNQQAAPPTTIAGALSKNGHAADTHVTGETHPASHSLEDFVAMNRHLTPRDLQVLSAYLPPQGAHEQILQDVRKGFEGKLQKDMQQAQQLRASGKPADIAAADALEKNAAQKHLEDLQTFAGVTANPYATANAYGFGRGAPPPRE